MNWTKIKFLGLAVGLMFPSTSCVEEEPKVVPDVYVNFRIDLDLPEFIELKAPGNAIVYSNEGYHKNGVIIYSYSIDEFFAFDATCPQHVEESTAIAIVEDGFYTGKCPHCNTTYSFHNWGQASSGYPLKRYKTTLSGSFLYITN
jgi:hypothetical protein